MFLNFCSVIVDSTSLVNVEIYELYITCIFLFVTIYVFAVLLS